MSRLLAEYKPQNFTDYKGEQQAPERVNYLRGWYRHYFNNIPHREIAGQYGEIDEDKINDYYELKLLNPEI